MLAEIWHSLVSHPQFFAMLTIPFVTAVVTWAHVWMALKMLFYPIHFWGLPLSKVQPAFLRDGPPVLGATQSGPVA